MARIEKTVFVSYRRTDEAWGLAIFQDLTQHGYDVFIDYEGIASGNFGTVILENIGARAHFLVLLTPTALERCSDPKDWMRREIEAALDSRRNIVPLMLEGFDFGKVTIAGQLTGKLAALQQYNGLEVPKGYFQQAMERLRTKFLNVPVDAVLHTASGSAKQVAKEQKDRVDAIVHTASGSTQQAATDQKYQPTLAEFAKQASASQAAAWAAWAAWAAEDILRHLNAGQFVGVWKHKVSKSWKDQYTEDFFLSSMAQGRPMLGRLQDIKLVSNQHTNINPMTGFAGDMYFVTFRNTYSVGEFYETVAVVRDDDGIFRCSGITGAPRAKMINVAQAFPSRPTHTLASKIIDVVL
jgi:hypothetical protein